MDRWANGQCGPAAWHLSSGWKWRWTRTRPGDDGEGVEWRDVRCYATDDASLVVHRNADDPSVYSLSHAPTGRSIPTEATGIAGFR